MFRFPNILGIVGCFLLFSSICPADDKPRLQVEVTKKSGTKTLGRIFGDEDSTRAITLAIKVTNSSVRPLPAGVVEWTVVVRRRYGGMFKQSGKMDLPPLVSFKSAELLSDSIEFFARPGAASSEKDRLEYEVVVSHNGKESHRTASTTNFTTLAQNAETRNNWQHDEENKPDKEKPPEPAPAEVAKMAQPTVVPDKPAAPRAAEPPPVPAQPFDFFNLAGRKSPAP